MTQLEDLPKKADGSYDVKDNRVKVRGGGSGPDPLEVEWETAIEGISVSSDSDD